MPVFSAPQVIAAAAWQGWGVLLFPLGWGMAYLNAAVRRVVWGTSPLGGVLGGALGTLVGVRPALWPAFVGSWAAGWSVFFSPLRRMRDVPQAAPASAPVVTS